MTRSSNRAFSAMIPGSFDEETFALAAKRGREELGGRATVAFLFVSTDWLASVADVIEVLMIHGHCSSVIGCSGHGLIGIDEEEEEAHGASLLMLHLPQTEVFLSELDATQMENAAARSRGWKGALGWNAGETAGVITLVNPAEVPADQWVTSWNECFPGVPCFGGLTSGSSHPADWKVFTSKGCGRTRPAMAVAGFRGGVRCRGVVSQGCRPIGEPFTITGARDQFILRVGSKPAFEVLQDTFRSLSEQDREQAQGNILAGLAMSEYVDEFKPGDFLVSNIVGGDPSNGILKLAARARVGQTLQFQLRDSKAADGELRTLMHSVASGNGNNPLAGLLFTCTGRGERMFGVPNHDVAIIAEHFGATPLSGFFCNGEVGTTGNATHVHGFTASALFFYSE